MRKIISLILCFLAVTLVAQNQTVTFMTYNLMYFRASSSPCTHTETPSQRAAHLETIFDFVKPEIFLVNELGSTPTNADLILSSMINVNGVSKYNKASYSNNSFSSLVNMLFFDTTVVELYQQDRIEEDLNNQDLVRVLDVYTLYYKDPGLKLGADTIYLTIVGAHLKAGSGTADQIQRRSAVEALMDYLENNFPSSNVLFAGDFNIYRNSEPAYQELVSLSDTSVRFNDPINQPGNWNNNANYSSIHTQSTHSSSSGCHSGGGCDDRFDFILASNAVMNGNKGVEYKLNSYKTLGQDGNHFNQSINNGSNSSAPANIIDALYNLSDHLPVYADFEFKASGIGLSELSSQLAIRFNNPASQTLSIQLEQAYAETIRIEIIDLSGKTVQRSQLKKGETRMSLDCASWNKGLYLLRFSDSKGGITTKKLIKH
jgi:hypothetical protein